MDFARSAEDVLDELREIAEGDAWAFGKQFSYVFDGPDLADLTAEAMRLFAGSNGLDPTAFPSFLRFENDLVDFARSILHGDEHVRGAATSGGTESIILACKAARDARRAAGVPGRLNMVLPITAHAAFHKAAAYLDLELRVTDVDADFRAIPEAMEAAVDEQTALLVASAPSYTHGVVDPVEAIGQVAERTGRWFHVDACVGGMVLPFLDDAPPFDFAVPAVDSISMDLHKYGYTPKGASLVVHRDAGRRAHQYFATAGWMGYPVANSTIQSTKSATSLAAAWASVERLGTEGYARLTADSWEATQRFIDAVDASDLVDVVARPDAPLCAVTSADVFTHGQGMRARGWRLGVTPSLGHSPAHLHFTMTAAHLDLLDELVTDLLETAPSEPAGGLDGLAGIDLGSLDPSMIGGLLDSLDLDTDRAFVDAAIDSLDPAGRAAVISAFIQHLYR